MGKGTPSPAAGIQTLPEAVRSTAMRSLASDTSVIINSSYGTALLQDFLLKKLRYQFILAAYNPASMYIMGFCRGDMAIAEISAALATQLVDPQDFQSWDSFAQAKGIYWQTLRTLAGVTNTADAGEVINVDGDVSIGGKNGIPLEHGVGIQMFIFNPSGATTGTSETLNGLFQLVGVFMEDR